MDNTFASAFTGVIDEGSATTPVITGTVAYQPWCVRLARLLSVPAVWSKARV
ncbi:hypothetical protein [Streptomyces mirabilis]|uniref:hypothetical protein n=1 Tax=Streptomyces mirabilis TaxID=68239 RepID=UPI00365C401B